MLTFIETDDWDVFQASVAEAIHAGARVDVITNYSGGFVARAVYPDPVPVPEEAPVVTEVPPKPAKRAARKTVAKNEESE